MTDLSQTIAPKSDQLNSDDLIGGPRTITITRVSANEGTPEQPINIYFEGDGGKPYRPGKSMRRVLVQVWGKDGATYVGRSLTLYRDPDVQFGGLKVGGTRISHMSHIDKQVTMALTTTKASRKPFTVQPLVVERGPDTKALLAEADAAARNGTEAFRTWWAGASPDARTAAKANVVELQKTAAEADAAATADTTDDPFGLPPLDGDRPSPDEMERAAREAEEAAAKAREGVE